MTNVSNANAIRQMIAGSIPDNLGTFFMAKCVGTNEERDIAYVEILEPTLEDNTDDSGEISQLEATTLKGFMPQVNDVCLCMHWTEQIIIVGQLFVDRLQTYMLAAVYIGSLRLGYDFPSALSMAKEFVYGENPLTVGPPDEANWIANQSFIQGRDGTAPGDCIPAPFGINPLGGWVDLAESSAIFDGSTYVKGRAVLGKQGIANAGGEVLDGGLRQFLRTSSDRANPTLVQAGTAAATTDASGDITVTFPEAFTASSPDIVATLVSNVTPRFISIHTRSSTGFKCRIWTLAGAADTAVSRTIGWMAMAANSNLG